MLLVKQHILPLTLLLFSVFSSPVLAQHDPDPIQKGEQGRSHDEHLPEGDIVKEEYDAAATTMHHLGDSYSFDLWKQDGHYVGFQFPRIFFDQKTNQLRFFLTTTRAKEAGYIDPHDFHGLHRYTKDVKHGFLMTPSAHGELQELEEQVEAGTLAGEEAELQLDNLIREYGPWDFSITKNVFFMLITALLMLLIFGSMGKRYKSNPNRAPKGVSSFFEPIVVFIRDDIGKNYIPHQYERFMPLLCTMFFFIWFLNMFGLVPFGANVTGNISVTLALALITLVITNINGTKTYWGHIFWFPGVPLPVKFLMMIVEVIGIFTKPFALMVRLFANITAGHVIILSLIGLIFILGEMGANPAAGWGVSILSTVFVLFIDLLELFVALLQAYVFTLLSAVFIGQALEDHTHHEEAAH